MIRPLALSALLLLAACAGPVTRAPTVQDAAVAREQALQRAYAAINDEGRAWLDKATTILTATRRRLVATNSDLCGAVCGPAQLEVSNDYNAYADGHAAVVTSAMAGMLLTYDEVAFVLAHEYAHNILGHLGAIQRNQLVGGLMGALATGLTGANLVGVGAEIGGQAYLQDFETEADVLGAYMTARAGYDLGPVLGLWRRLASANPASIHAENGNHPNTARRLLVLEQVATEIERKRRAGLPLLPDKR